MREDAHMTNATAKRTAHLGARVRPRELEVAKAAARARGVHVSELVREATLRAARRELTGPEETTGTRNEGG